MSEVAQLLQRDPLKSLNSQQGGSIPPSLSKQSLSPTGFACKRQRASQDAAPQSLQPEEPTPAGQSQGRDAALEAGAAPKCDAKSKHSKSAQACPHPAEGSRQEAVHDPQRISGAGAETTGDRTPPANAPEDGGQSFMTPATRRAAHQRHQNEEQPQRATRVQPTTLSLSPPRLVSPMTSRAQAELLSLTPRLTPAKAKSLSPHSSTSSRAKAASHDRPRGSHHGSGTGATPSKQGCTLRGMDRPAIGQADGSERSSRVGTTRAGLPASAPAQMTYNPVHLHTSQERQYASPEQPASGQNTPGQALREGERQPSGGSFMPAAEELGAISQQCQGDPEAVAAEKEASRTHVVAAAAPQAYAVAPSETLQPSSPEQAGGSAQRDGCTPVVADIQCTMAPSNALPATLPYDCNTAADADPSLADVATAPPAIEADHQLTGLASQAPALPPVVQGESQCAAEPLYVETQIWEPLSVIPETIDVDTLEEEEDAAAGQLTPGCPAICAGTIDIELQGHPAVLPLSSSSFPEGHQQEKDISASVACEAETLAAGHVIKVAATVPASADADLCCGTEVVPGQSLANLGFRDTARVDIVVRSQQHSSGQLPSVMPWDSKEADGCDAAKHAGYKRRQQPGSQFLGQGAITRRDFQGAASMSQAPAIQQADKSIPNAQQAVLQRKNSRDLASASQPCNVMSESGPTGHGSPSSPAAKAMDAVLAAHRSPRSALRSICRREVGLSQAEVMGGVTCSMMQDSLDSLPSSQLLPLEGNQALADNAGGMFYQGYAWGVAQGGVFVAINDGDMEAIYEALCRNPEVGNADDEAERTRFERQLILARYMQNLLQWSLEGAESQEPIMALDSMPLLEAHIQEEELCPASEVARREQEYKKHGRIWYRPGKLNSRSSAPASSPGSLPASTSISDPPDRHTVHSAADGTSQCQQASLEHPIAGCPSALQPAAQVAENPAASADVQRRPREVAGGLYTRSMRQLRMSSDFCNEKAEDQPAPPPQHDEGLPASRGIGADAGLGSGMNNMQAGLYQRSKGDAMSLSYAAGPMQLELDIECSPTQVPLQLRHNGMAGSAAQEAASTIGPAGGSSKLDTAATGPGSSSPLPEHSSRPAKASGRPDGLDAGVLGKRDELHVPDWMASRGNTLAQLYVRSRADSQSGGTKPCQASKAEQAPKGCQPSQEANVPEASSGSQADAAEEGPPKVEQTPLAIATRRPEVEHEADSSVLGGCDPTPSDLGDHAMEGATPVPWGGGRNALSMSMIFGSGGADHSQRQAAPGSRPSAGDARRGLLPGAANPSSKISACLVAAAIAHKGPSAAIRGTAIRRRRGSARKEDMRKQHAASLRRRELDNSQPAGLAAQEFDRLAGLKARSAAAKPPAPPRRVNYPSSGAAGAFECGRRQKQAMGDLPTSRSGRPAAGDSCQSHSGGEIPDSDCDDDDESQLHPVAAAAATYTAEAGGSVLAATPSVNQHQHDLSTSDCGLVGEQCLECPSATQPAIRGMVGKNAAHRLILHSDDLPALSIEQPPLERLDPENCQAQLPEGNAAPQANVTLVVERQGQEPGLQGQQGVAERSPRRALKVKSRPQAPRQPLLQRKGPAMASNAHVGQLRHNLRQQALLCAQNDYQHDPYRFNGSQDSAAVLPQAALEALRQAKQGPALQLPPSRFIPVPQAGLAATNEHTRAQGEHKSPAPRRRPQARRARRKPSRFETTDDDEGDLSPQVRGRRLRSKRRQQEAGSVTPPPAKRQCLVKGTTPEKACKMRSTMEVHGKPPRMLKEADGVVRNAPADTGGEQHDLQAVGKKHAKLGCSKCRWSAKGCLKCRVDAVAQVPKCPALRTLHCPCQLLEDVQKQKRARPATASPRKRGKCAAAVAGDASQLSLDGAQLKEQHGTSPADATHLITLNEQRLAEGCLGSQAPGRNDIAKQASKVQRQLLPDGSAAERLLRWLEPRDGPPTGLPAVPHWTYYSGFALGSEEIRLDDDVELLPNGYARNRVGRVVALWSEPITSTCDLKLACIRHYVHPQETRFKGGEGEVYATDHIEDRVALAAVVGKCYVIGPAVSSREMEQAPHQEGMKVYECACHYNPMVPSLTAANPTLAPHT